jgi:hypothetical protein
MRLIILCAFLFAVSISSTKAQYDFYIKSLIKDPTIISEKISGEFARKGKESDPKGWYYEFSNPSFPICYYPPNQDCGYFDLFGKQYLIKGKYKAWEEFGCDLDGETLEAFQLKMTAETI